MSYSSLYAINKEGLGEVISEYGNSWLFSPIVWRVLPEKYIPNEIQTPYGYKKSMIGIDGTDIWRKTNEKVNHCKNTSDRVCWELSNQNIFLTKDKVVIAESIRQFLRDNKEYDKSDEDGKSSLEREHIIERFEKIAADIEELDEIKYPHFVLKNTSCDDEVERWFLEYDEETDEYVGKSLKDWDEFLAAFVVIDNGEIVNFIPNTEYEYEQAEGEMQVELQKHSTG